MRAEAEDESEAAFLEWQGARSNTAAFVQMRLAESRNCAESQLTNELGSWCRCYGRIRITAALRA